MNCIRRRYIQIFMQTGVALTLMLPLRGLADSCGGVTVSTALGNCNAPSGTNPIFALIQKAVTYATGIFGLVLVLMIVIAGLEYVIAGGSADKVKGAKTRLQQAATGFVLFVLMWGVLQALLPDGIFR
jgi:hypothetical protein